MEKDKQGAYVRELEQKNDDLERGQRYFFLYLSSICKSHNYLGCDNGDRRELLLRALSPTKVYRGVHIC